jgi:transketolase N-terminal domain/subunit
MANFQEEMSTQIKRLRDHVETFVHDKVNPTVERATASIKSTVDTSSRLDALIAVLVEKGIITEEELKRHAKSAAPATSHPADMVPPPTQDQV